MSSPVGGSLSIGAAAPEDAASWNAFVARQPDASHCHRYEWRPVAERAYRRSCTYLAGRRGGEIVGVLPLVWMPGRMAGRRLVSMPYLDLGGALAAEASTERALLDAALELADGLGARSIELRESAEPGSEAPGGRYRFVLDLPSDPETLWQSLAAKVRNQIRKSRKSGLSTAPASADDLPRFYEVFARNMRDLGSPVHAPRFFGEVFERFGDDAELHLTTDRDGRTVAGAVAISFGATLAVPWASALRSARPLCPNHSLYWSILASASGRGIRRFDFGRSSAGTGTYRFKKQWGAVPVPLAWRELDRAGSRLEGTAAVSRGARALVSIWRRLPLGIANRLGPAVRGRLPQ